MKPRQLVILVLVILTVAVVATVTECVVWDMQRRQRSIEKRDRVLELIPIGMPGQEAIEILRENGFKVSEHEGRTVAGARPFLVVTIDSDGHFLSSLAYSMDMNTEGIGPIGSVVFKLDEAGNVVRAD